MNENRARKNIWHIRKNFYLRKNLGFNKSIIFISIVSHKFYKHKFEFVLIHWQKFRQNCQSFCFSWSEFFKSYLLNLNNDKPSNIACTTAFKAVKLRYFIKFNYLNTNQPVIWFLLIIFQWLSTFRWIGIKNETAFYKNEMKLHGSK